MVLDASLHLVFVSLSILYCLDSFSHCYPYFHLRFIGKQQLYVQYVPFDYVFTHYLYIS